MISIVLCTYNGERFLQKQIDSLLQQTWKNFEIIIADDDSKDNTKAILEQYQQDQRFKISFHSSNIGAIRNFEFATRQAKGDYLAFCDQDDIWIPEKLEILYHSIGNALLVYSNSLLIDENGQSLQKKLSDLRRMGNVEDTKGFIFSNVVWGHTMMIHQSLIEMVLPIPAKIPHDIWFAVKATIHSGIKYVDQPLTLYRQHAHTVTTTVAQKTVTRKHEQRFRDFEYALNWMQMIQTQEIKDPLFYEKLITLFKRKAAGVFVWTLFYFLLKHQSVIFQFTFKSYFSRLVEIRKLSRGEMHH